jgi:uncharacterized ferritin-like protein (DUF455 family)
VRRFAERVLLSADLGDKLAPPPRDLSDEDRGDGSVPEWPARPPELAIVPGAAARVPSLEGWADPEQRRRIVHALANHELQAAELFARALLAFPDAPAELRRELAGVLREEQVHTRLHIRRLEGLGGRFGDHPVSGLIWRRTAVARSPAEFLAAMSLTFENANLDHAPAVAAVARRHGDEATARILDRIAEDEVRHVALGRRWLGRLAEPGESLWRAYLRHLRWPLHPGRARGARFEASARRAAGLDEEFIAGLAGASREAPRGDPRGDAESGAAALAERDGAETHR